MLVPKAQFFIGMARKHSLKALCMNCFSTIRVEIKAPGEVCPVCLNGRRMKR
jgi:rRNA maturation endonuclease Nob1